MPVPHPVSREVPCHQRRSQVRDPAAPRGVHWFARPLRRGAGSAVPWPSGRSSGSAFAMDGPVRALAASTPPLASRAEASPVLSGDGPGPGTRRTGSVGRSGSQLAGLRLGEEGFEIGAGWQGPVCVEGATGLDREAPVPERNPVVGQEAVRRFESGDACHSHLLDQAVLRRTEGPLDPSLRLGRACQDHLDRYDSEMGVWT